MQLLESKLSDIVNRSVVLAKYLMSEDFVSKEKLVKDLGTLIRWILQGDHSACAKPPIDFKSKVPLWPGLTWPG